MKKQAESQFGIALQKFKKNFWGVFSFWFIIFLLLISVFAYVIAPDATKNANNGDVSIRTKPPGFTVQIIEIPINDSHHFTDWLTGSEINAQHIPILDYHIQNDTLFYHQYNEDPQLAQEKSMPITVFQTEVETVKKQYINTNKFWLGKYNQGKDYHSRLIICKRV